MGEIRYTISNHEIVIRPNDNEDYDVMIKYRCPEGGIPGFLVPEIRYFHGEFRCDLTFPNSIMPVYPEDVDMLRRGLEITSDVVRQLTGIIAALKEKQKSE